MRLSRVTTAHSLCRLLASAACASVVVSGCSLPGMKRDQVASAPSLAWGSSMQLASHRINPQASSEETVDLIDAVEGQITEVVETRQAEFTPVVPAISGSALPRDANTLPDAFRYLSEGEMLSLALANSPVLRPLGLRVLDSPDGSTTVYDSAIAATDPFFGPQAALAEFDSVLSASVNAQNNDRVFNNATLGGDVQELVQDLVTASAGWQRRTHSGATLDISALNGYDDNNRVGNRFPNSYEAQLEAGIRQPLLQGAGRDFNLIAGPNARPGFNFSNGIVIARLNNKISDADFEIQVRNFVRDLYSAYWDLSRQYSTYQSVVAAQDLAYETWQSVLAKSEAKLSGGEANKEAQARARYYSFRREVQNALGGQNSGLYVSERRLRQLIGVPIVDGELLRPSDAPISVRYTFNFDHLVSRAVAQRTELRRQNLKVRQQQLRLTAAKNFLLPQLDLIGRYRLRGFGDDLTGDGARFSSAYQDFFSLDHQEWEFGVEMGVVAGRRQARAAISNATLKLSRERTVLKEQQRSLRHEISNAYAEIGSSFAAMETSHAQADASRQRLESSQALFTADKLEIEFLLDAQEELLQAEQQLATDQARYAVSLIAVNASAGSLLTDLGIVIRQTGCKSEVHYVGGTSLEMAANSAE
ncbi:MAG: TolC family protein [Rubripirellula sp.]